jgi:hypothetical protein
MNTAPFVEYQATISDYLRSRVEGEFDHFASRETGMQRPFSLGLYLACHTWHGIVSQQWKCN